MSERFTSVTLKDTPQGFGWAERGRRDPEEMIATLRQHARRDLERAQRVLDAPDSDFIVDTYVGAIVTRNREILWPITPEEAGS